MAFLFARTLREPGGERAPSFRIGSRGIIAREHDRAARLETRQFRIEHEEVRIARRDGDLSAVFPYPTYGARVLLNAPCKTHPKDTAFVTKPGPLLDDVMTDLAAQPRARHEESIVLIEEARAAFVDEANEVIEHDAMRFDDRAPVTNNNAGNKPQPQARRDRAVVHRFDKRDNDPATAPRRIVTLRDARRGRPPSTGKHGADPPA